MTSLIILIVLVVSYFVIKKYLAERHEQRLRENPPERRGIEVAIPHGTQDSPRQAAAFLRKVANAALGSEKERRSGQRQVDILYLAIPPAPGAESVLHFRIYCDPDKIDAIKRAVKQVYKGTCEVNEIKRDELAEVAEHFRPRPEEEPEEVSEGVAQ